MKLLRIIHSCVAFGRNVSTGDEFDLEEISANYRADVELLKGAGLTEVIERYEAPAEATGEPDPEDQDQVEDLDPLEQTQSPNPKKTKKASKKAKK